MSRRPGRAAIYARVSTDTQTVENQIRELKQIAERRGWEVVEVYTDAGISGAKGRAQRPGLDRMLKDAGRRSFDVVMAWAIDRLGRSLIDLLGTIQHLEAVGVDLYLDQQAIDTTTPMGVSGHRRIRRVRAVHDSAADQGGAQTRSRSRHAARTAQGRRCPGAQGAEAT
jgi:DNA invertase Pin-like site-specific DNA recombinase